MLRQICSVEINTVKYNRLIGNLERWLFTNRLCQLNYISGIPGGWSAGEFYDFSSTKEDIIQGNLKSFA